MQDEKIFEQFKDSLSRSSKGMEVSSTYLALFTENFKKDPKCLMELGLAVMLDKPIFLVVPNEVHVPDNLKRLARGIEFCDYDDVKDLKRASERLLNKAKKHGFM